MSPSYLLFGYGYSARAFAKQLQAQNIPVVATYRTTKPADIKSVAMQDTAQLAEAATQATHWLISAPPDSEGCPIARLANTQLLGASPRWVGYLSTTGVYGNHNGAWVEETTPPAPSFARTQRRVLAERQWQEFIIAFAGVCVILRLAGIYGEGRNVFCALQNGTARRIDKPEQMFSRIHRADIVQSLVASGALTQAGAHIFNVCDDMPSPASAPVEYAAELMGVAPPKAQSWEEAQKTLSPMGREFYSDNRKVRNTKLKEELGVRLHYPTYKQGLQALWESKGGRKIKRLRQAQTRHGQTASPQSRPPRIA